MRISVFLSSSITPLYQPWNNGLHGYNLRKRHLLQRTEVHSLCVLVPTIPQHNTMDPNACNSDLRWVAPPFRVLVSICKEDLFFFFSWISFSSFNFLLGPEGYLCLFIYLSFYLWDRIALGHLVFSVRPFWVSLSLSPPHLSCRQKSGDLENFTSHILSLGCMAAGDNSTQCLVAANTFKALTSLWPFCGPWMLWESVKMRPWGLVLPYDVK